MVTASPFADWKVTGAPEDDWKRENCIDFPFVKITNKELTWIVKEEVICCWTTGL